MSKTSTDWWKTVTDTFTQVGDPTCTTDDPKRDFPPDGKLTLTRLVFRRESDGALFAVTECKRLA